MWAWYQVVESCAVYQKTVPKAKKIVVRERGRRRRTGSRPSIHQQSATSIAARTVKIAWSFVARPHRATNGSEHERRAAAGTAAGRAPRRRS